MRHHGMTLLEVIVAMAILTVVSTFLFVMVLSLSRASEAQEGKIVAQDDARIAMQVVTRELRQAAMNSINSTGMPGITCTYKIATDLDGNGTAVNASGALELSDQRTFSLDTADFDGDGKTLTQLIMNDGATTRTLANNMLVEDTNNNGTLDSGEDTNGNGTLDRGIWFVSSGSGITVTVQTQRKVGNPQQRMESKLSEYVEPRN